jgi:hypothetical protein
LVLRDLEDARIILRNRSPEFALIDSIILMPSAGWKGRRCGIEGSFDCIHEAYKGAIGSRTSTFDIDKVSTGINFDNLQVLNSCIVSTHATSHLLPFEHTARVLETEVRRNQKMSGWRPDTCP